TTTLTATNSVGIPAGVGGGQGGRVGEDRGRGLHPLGPVHAVGLVGGHGGGADLDDIARRVHEGHAGEGAVVEQGVEPFGDLDVLELDADELGPADGGLPAGRAVGCALGDGGAAVGVARGQHL